MGFGGYVREQVLPCFRSEVRGAADYKADLLAKHVTTSFPLYRDAGTLLDAIADDPRPLVIISAYHSDHAALALRSLDANPRACVFVEKPAAVTAADAAALVGRRRAGAWIDAGYNRRYAPLLGELMRAMRAAERPWLVTMSVKELKLPPSHWYHWPNQGTRITGNACHWLDLALHLIGARPQEVTLVASGDTVAIAVGFADGSLANLSLGEAGDDLPGVREWIEVRGGSTTAVLDDFRRLSLSGSAGTRTRRLLRRDKGHASMYRELRRRWMAGEPPVYPLEDLDAVCALTATAAGMLVRGERWSAVESSSSAGIPARAADAER